MDQTLSIGDAAKTTGVSEKQLRHWEKAEYLQNIKRSISGERAYRRYTEEDIEHIKAMKAYLDEGFTLPAASAKASRKEEK